MKFLLKDQVVVDNMGLLSSLPSIAISYSNISVSKKLSHLS